MADKVSKTKAGGWSETSMQLTVALINAHLYLTPKLTFHSTFIRQIKNNSRKTRTTLPWV